jgi:hypothetical protein
MRRPDLSIKQILAWMDDFHERAGRWPNRSVYRLRIPGALGDTWCAIDQALRKGLRSLSGGSSLAKLAAAERGVRHRLYSPPLSLKQILRWADAHHRRTGQWPTVRSGPIAGASGETWIGVHRALRYARRSLTERTTLARLLLKHRGKRSGRAVPNLSLKQILAWADAHHRRTGGWPTRASGPIRQAPAETWAGVDAALIQNGRSLRGGWSLARLLEKKRGVRNRKHLPNLRIAQVLRCADLYYRRHGKWPRHTSGPIPELPGETWSGVHAALYAGGRGFTGGSSLFQLLATYRGARRRYGARRR